MLESSEKQDENDTENSKTPRWLFALFLAGFILLFVGVAVAIAASLISGNQVSGGVVIFIGPVPLVFGAGPGATWLVLIGAILSVLSVILFVIMRRKFAKK